MNYYTTEELKNLNEDELFELTEGIKERVDEFSNEELQIISKNLKNKRKDIGIEMDRVEDILDLLTNAMQYCYDILPEQLEAIKCAYEACDLQDWGRCRFALEIFFEYVDTEDIYQPDLSGWSNKHIMRWLTMLASTKLNEEPEDSSARLFFQILSKAMKHIALQ